MEEIQDVVKPKEVKTWRKDKNGGCLCQSLKQFQGCRYYHPIEHEVCQFLDPLGYFKCILRVAG